MNTASDASGDEARSAEPLVRDIMTTPVVTVSPDLSLKGLVAVFRDRGVGGAPVVDTGGMLLGMVTDGDLMALDADVRLPHYFELFDSIIYLGSQKKFKEQLEKAAAANVRQLMTPFDELKTVKPDDPARQAATLMSRHKIGRVPVVDEHRILVGLVTRHDIIRLLEL